MNDPSDSLLSWILQNIEGLRLSAQVNNWKSLMGEDYHDCKTAVYLNDQLYEGRGSSQSEEIAFLKGFCEAIDRASFVDSGARGSTNGLAVHPDPAKAEEYARCEIIERDKFFCHYLTKARFFSPQYSLKDAGFSDNALGFLKQNGLRFRLAEMRRSTDVYSYIFMAHGLESEAPLGFMFGMGCRPNPLDAIKSAVIEGLRHIISNLHNGDLKSITENQFKRLGFWTPEDHLLLTNDLNYVKKISSWIFDLENESANSVEARVLEEIPVKSLSPPFGITAPVSVRKAIQTDYTQDLFFGPVSKDYINFKRLSVFSGREVKWSQINQTPHPMG